MNDYEKRFNYCVNGWSSRYTDDPTEVVAAIQRGGVNFVSVGHADVIEHEDCTEYVRIPEKSYTPEEFLADYGPDKEGRVPESYINARGTTFRVGDRVRVSERAQSGVADNTVGKITALYSDVIGGVLLDRKVGWFNSWNVDDLVKA